MEIVEQHRCAGGEQLVLGHHSERTGTSMRYGLFLPPGERRGLLLFLSGLTCTEQNVITKGHFQAAAAAHGLVVLCPDTSPRGEGVADDEAWDMGQGAGFYLDATREPWRRHFQMRSYVLDELLPAVQAEHAQGLPVGITGHSMGGHGALVLALSEPHRFASVSALSPIASATRCPWGHKALAGYLGPRSAAWDAQDASLLLAHRRAPWPILVDQGAADGFLEEQLKPELLEEAARVSGSELTVRRHEGYDHGYYFVQTVLPVHVAWHAERMAG